MDLIVSEHRSTGPRYSFILKAIVFSDIHGPIIGTAYAILWTKAILIMIVLGE